MAFAHITAATRLLAAGLLAAAAATPHAGQAAADAPERPAAAGSAWLSGGVLRPEAEAFVARLAAEGAAEEAARLAGLVARGRSGGAARDAAARGLQRALAARLRAPPAAPGAAPMVVADAGAEMPAAPADGAAFGPWLDQALDGGPVAARFAAALARAPAPLRPALRADLARARAMPAAGERTLLVNIPAQRLFMMERGRVVGSMRVVVGRPDAPTPTLAAEVREIVLNPWWNLPPDLARRRVAASAAVRGASHLARGGFQALDGWQADARPIDPAGVDWAAAAAGQIDVRVRQRPGPANPMGGVKLMLSAPHGIFLHGTPDRAALARPQRLASAGCVRVEDAAALLRWLFNGAPPAADGTSEQRVALPWAVSARIAYFTTWPEGTGVTHLPDVYGWNRNGKPPER